MMVVSKVLIDQADLVQQRGEISAVPKPRRKKENNSSKKVNVIYASSKGINFMIVPIGRGLTLQPIRELMLEKGRKGMMLQARRIDLVQG